MRRDLEIARDLRKLHPLYINQLVQRRSRRAGLHDVCELVEQEHHDLVTSDELRGSRPLAIFVGNPRGRQERLN